ncbi:probable ATP-dependent RNA helicase DDX31 [Oppia nitens]|uniref:probable ATP-dependent RNA helicase DDX31 n=1 Tax=Oppia nitens TaxID=1686743 RepID=UPI0023DCA713|nr:probable ATP-dependent RNA helicase DDX31 [Oppia nitens]
MTLNQSSMDTTTTADDNLILNIFQSSDDIGSRGGGNKSANKNSRKRSAAPQPLSGKIGPKNDNKSLTTTTITTDRSSKGPTERSSPSPQRSATTMTSSPPKWPRKQPSTDDRFDDRQQHREAADNNVVPMGRGAGGGDNRRENKGFATRFSGPNQRRQQQQPHYMSRLFDGASNDLPSVDLIDAKTRVEPVFSSHKYSELPIDPVLVKCLKERFKIETTTAVQQQAIPVLMSGSDALIKSMTGSGKTLAFAVPIIQRLQSIVPHITRADGIHALVVVPTRELALQCYECFFTLCQYYRRLVPGYLCGGEKKKSEKSRIRKGINILVTTPGRLLDHLQSTQTLHLRRVKWFVIDEADRLLEQGFEDSIKQITDQLHNECYDRPQTVLLSATLTEPVQKLAGISLTQPKTVDIGDEVNLNNNNLQTYVLPDNLTNHYVIVAPKLRLVTLSALLLEKCSLVESSKALVFMSGQDVVDYYCILFNTVFNKLLIASNHRPINFCQLHGSMDQSKRQQVFREFRQTRNGVLFCTDVAARGIDVPEVDWIIQYNCAPKPEDFVHRVGRTARIGKLGNAVQFVLPTETRFLELLQKELNINLKELNAKQLLKSLMLLTFQRKVFTDEEYATELQSSYESALTADQDLQSLAKKAYLSYIRSYATYPKQISEQLPFKSIHLGHLAKSFALQESPKALGAYGYRLKQQSIDLQQKYNSYNRRVQYSAEHTTGAYQPTDGDVGYGSDVGDNDNDYSIPSADGSVNGVDRLQLQQPAIKRPKLTNGGNPLPNEMRNSEFGGQLITKPIHKKKKSSAAPKKKHYFSVNK